LIIRPHSVFVAIQLATLVIAKNTAHHAIVVYSSGLIDYAILTVNLDSMQIKIIIHAPAALTGAIHATNSDAFLAMILLIIES